MSRLVRILEVPLRLRLSMIALGALIVAVSGLVVATRADLLPAPRTLSPSAAHAVQMLDRRGTVLNITFENEWNVHDVAPLHEIPPFLRLAFLHAEDKRFYEHGGPDWLARISAAATNLAHLEAVRGASTITEQVVRMLNPRPRTVWTRWLEGFEAAALEESFTKDEILEFYLNQVPYASNRRGVSQAASHYFARDLETLSRKEMLALAVLVRSPSRLDLYKSTDTIAGAIERLADLMLERRVLGTRERDWILADDFELERPKLAVVAPHFLRFVESQIDERFLPGATVATTLDAGLQRELQRMLDQRIAQLADRALADGALLVVENASRHVLAWVVGGGADEGGPRTHIDAALSPRQPGSALKPFLYALAIEKGWTATEVIEDAPLTAEVGEGLHSYVNYSRRFYGPVSLRDALGNSLNIPALKALRFVGSEDYLEMLRALGFEGLEEHPDFYGDGIALGNGEVSLFELVQAYVALANAGEFAPLETLARGVGAYKSPRRISSAESASLIANILSDDEARTLEFGRHGVLSYPFQTAVKTGTSSDFRDAWAVGFNSRFTVGVWLGNLDRTPTDGLTGSTGPGLLLRAAFSELMRGREPEPLYLSPKLTQRRVCVPLPAAAVDCIERDEWFLPGSEPEPRARAGAAAAAVRFRQPTPGLELAMDPRLPDDAQALKFQLENVEPDDEVRWLIDGGAVTASGDTYVWPLARGTHEVGAAVFRDRRRIATLEAVDFVVR